VTSDAVVTWIRGRPHPTTDDDRVVAAHGAEVLPALRRLRDDTFSSDAAQRGTDLAEVGRLVEADIRRAHPELSGDAVAALTDLYTYAWR
jgi:hypothetical protein